MGQVTILPTTSAIRRNSGIMKPSQNALRKIIDAAAALQRWEELEEAVDILIEAPGGVRRLVG